MKIQIEIDNVKNDSKLMWKTLKKIVNPMQGNSVTSIIRNKENIDKNLPTVFNNYFMGSVKEVIKIFNNDFHIANFENITNCQDTLKKINLRMLLLNRETRALVIV